MKCCIIFTGLVPMLAITLPWFGPTPIKWAVALPSTSTENGSQSFTLAIMDPQVDFFYKQCKPFWAKGEWSCFKKINFIMHGYYFFFQVPNVCIFAGNYIGGQMYKQGRACSQCPSGTSCSLSYPGLCSKSTLINSSKLTLFENHPKGLIWIFVFWHFPSNFVLLKLTCLVALFDREL